METSLHRQLKDHYSSPGAELEVTLENYRIDVVVDDLLIEIQHGSLAAIRGKIGQLLDAHDVLVVKPIVSRKLLIKRSRKRGKVVSRRKSPKRGGLIDIFDELVYFTNVFPHPRLTLEVPLVAIEEWRFPGHGRRRRRRENDFVVEDQQLVEIEQVYRFRTADDLDTFLPPELPVPFHTGQLAQQLGVERWIAQRVAYCLRHMGALRRVGKQGNAWLYERSASRGAA